MTLASGLDAGASAGAHSLARYRSEFPIFRDAVYLNTCSLGPLGQRTRRRITEFIDLWQARGASAWYDVWWSALAELRARYARIVGASPEEIALAPSVSVALSAVAEALDYRRRPKVVVTSLDFPTVAYQWLAKRPPPHGAELVVVESPDQVPVPDDARRFELGTPALAAVYAQLGGLDYIDEIGVPAIRRVTSGLTEDLVARARDHGFRPKVASRAEDRSAIVMLPAADPAAGVRHLAAGGIIADARPGHVRLSPFFYNVQDDHVSALERLATHTGH